MKSFDCLKNYGIEFWHIHLNNVTLLECTLLPVELKKIGLIVLFKNVTPAKQEELLKK